MKKRFSKFIHANKTEFFVICFIVFVALAVRLWRISEYLTFLGDEGRDVRIVRDLLRGNLVFIGPMTSIGNMYLGPLYYYLMAPALWLSNLDPVGPAAMNAILGTITVILTWWVGRTWFNPLTGIIAAILFALSPVAIIYSHSSWNPNPMPFFSLLVIWSAWQVWRKHNFVWLIVEGVALAFALQMHYLGLLLIPTIAVFSLLTFKDVWSDKGLKKQIIIYRLLSIVVFLLLMSPLVLFDLKHNGQNFNAFKQFFTDRQTTVNLNPARSDRFLPAIESVAAELLLGRQLKYALLSAIIILVGSIWSFKKNIKQRKELFLLFTWIGFGILGLGIYKQHIYAHYFGFLFPAIYLLTGFLLSFLWKRTIPFKLISLILFSCLIFHAVVYSPLKQSPNRQLQRTEQVVDLIIQESNRQEFNFGLIAKQNYDESYRYFLENKNAKLVRGEEKVVDQLFVVCEDGEKCQPEGSPQWQIAVFGPSKVDMQWQIDHIKIYRMIHQK